MRYQQLVGDQLSDFVKLLAVANGLKGSLRNLVLLHLDSDSSFGDLDNLLAKCVDIDQHESSLDKLCARACRDKPTPKGRGNDNLSTKSQIPALSSTLKTEANEKKGKEKKKASLTKGKAKLILPSLQPIKARGSMRSFQKQGGATYAGRERA